MTPLDSLQAIHEELWDARRGMDRYAPGVVPGVDIAPFDLHSVRETALGAFLDLEDGDVGRAVVAIGNVLALQYPASDWPWSGTFPVTAEQHDPPGTEAVEWVHYDPNWRQFVGCILAMCAIQHGGALPTGTLDDIDDALLRCVRGEPEQRIARWYTNPNLMHAWLLGHVGVRRVDDDLVTAGERRLRSIVERFERHGDIDEYNSPTYDGIDLWALGLWAMHPPTSRYAEAAASMLPRIGARISTLYHPSFGTTCGPYIRAYGLAPARYVSLSGLVFSLCGEPTDVVLPWPIDPDTVHVHDLYFLPVLRHVVDALAPHLRLGPVTTERRHDQYFTGSVASSLLRPAVAVGWEHGRRHEASLDQYVPFSVHSVDSSGTGSAFGVMVPPETAWIDVDRIGDLEFLVRAGGRDGSVGLRLVSAEPIRDEGMPARVAGITLAGDRPADSSERSSTPAGHELHLTWLLDQVELRITIDDRE